MGWQTSKPSGSGTYQTLVTNYKISASYYSLTYSISMARLVNNQVSICVTETLGYGSKSNSQITPPYKKKLGLKPNGASESTVEFSNSGQTRYWVGNLNYNQSATFTLYIQGNSGDNMKAEWTRSITGPSYTTVYNLYYNSNGGSGAPTTDTFTYGVAKTISSTRPKRTGYTFLGWNTSDTATTSAYSPGGTYTFYGSVKLYAVWEVNDYTISYDGNGPGGASVTNVPASESESYKSTYTVSSDVPVCTGYAFNHWNTAPDDTGTIYQGGSTFTVPASDVTLYAIWDGTYGITYDGNGATGGSTTPQTKIDGVDIQLSANGFLWDKHTFVEWNTAANGSGTSYDPGDEYTLDAPLYLYALWLKNNIPVFYKDSNGTVHQVEKAYYKDSNGVVHECAVYYKDSNGVVHEIA